MAIKRFLGENYGSLISIDYVPTWQVLSFIPTGQTINAVNILLLPGYIWQNIYCTQDTMGHRQQQQLDDNGAPWIQTVIGFVPGDEDEIEAGLGDLTGEQQYLVRVTRPNGIVKIVGRPDQPLTVAVDSNSQSTVPGRAGSAITFTGKTLKRALTLTN